MEQFGAIWSHLEPFGDILSHLEPFGAIWSHFNPFGARHLEPFGVIWSHLEPDMETFNYFFLIDFFLGGGAFLHLKTNLMAHFLAPFGLFVGMV